jgi:translocation and assembly module TamB
MATNKRRIIQVALIAVPLTAALLFAAAAAILHSKSFQDYALGKILAGVRESTGAEVRVQRMNVSYSPFAVVLYGVVAKNPAVAPSETPLLLADRLRVSLRIRPLLHHQVQIENLVVDHPVVYVRTANDGHTNLPAPPSNDQSSTPTMVVQIAYFVINNGLLQYDDRQTPLSAEFQGFRTEVNFSRLTNSYKGVVAYDVGRIQTAQTRTFDHKAELRFDADAKHCVVESLDVSLRRSHLALNGDLSNYASPEFAGQYQAGVSGEDVGWILKDPTLPAGDVVLQGKATYRTAAGNAWHERVQTDGTLESVGLTVPSGSSHVAIHALRAGYQLKNGQLQLKDARAEVFGGRLASDTDVIDLVNNSGSISFNLRGASVEQAVRVAGAGNPQAPQVAALADLDLTAKWKGSLNNAVAHIRTTLRQTSSPSPTAIPLDGNIALDYDVANNRASFQQSTIRTGNTQLTLSGVVSRDSALGVSLSTRDLRELGTLIAVASPSATSQQIAAYDVHGGAEFSGKVSGAVADPHIDGQLSVTDLQFSQTKWKSVRAHVAVDSHSLAVADGSLVNATQGRMTFDGQTRLVNWSPDPTAPFAAHARIEQISAADLERLANATYPIEGLLSGEISASGSQRQPSAHGHLELSKAVVWNEPLNLFSVNVEADRQTIHINGDVRAAAGAMTARLAYEPSSKHYEILLKTDNLTLEKVQALQRSAGPLTGQLSANISGTGTIDEPGLSAHLQIPDLEMRGESFHQVDAQLDAKGKHTEFCLKSDVEQTSIQAKGTVELTPSYPVNATLDTGQVPIGPLLARFVPNSQHGADGKMEIHATIQGPLQTPAQLQAQAQIPVLQLQAQTIKLVNAAPIRMSYRAGVLQLDEAEMKGDNTDIHLNGTIPLRGSGAMNVNANGSVNLVILQPWTDGGSSSGQLNVQLKVQGPLTQPAIDGRVRIANAVFTSDTLPVGIESLNGDLAIAGNRLDISNLTAQAGGGTINVTGNATYGKNSNFNLALRANSVRIRQSGVRSVLNADLAWNGSQDNSILSGRVVVDKLAFNQGSDLSEILGQFSDDETVSDPSSFARNVKLNVAVQSSENLNLASSQLSIAGSANLNAQGTAANPVVLGRISLTSGEIFFLGKRFEIDSGTISFSNPVRTDPIVNLQVKTTVEQYNITASILGPVDKLKTTYTSEPALPTADIINLLAFGQTTAEGASNGNTPASVGAESAVASAAGGQLASQVQKLTGISQLTLNPLAGNNQNPGSQVAIQQRVSGNILLTFSTDITSAQNESIQVQYQAKKNVSISVLRDENGGYGIDVRYHKVF